MPTSDRKDPCPMTPEDPLGSSPFLSDLPPHPHHTGHTSTGRPHTRGTFSRPSWAGTPAPHPSLSIQHSPFLFLTGRATDITGGGGTKHVGCTQPMCTPGVPQPVLTHLPAEPSGPFLGAQFGGDTSKKQKQTATKTANFPLSNLWAWLPICSCQGATSFGDQIKTLPRAFVLPLISHTHEQRSLWGWETPTEPGHVLQRRTEDPQSWRRIGLSPSGGTTCGHPQSMRHWPEGLGTKCWSPPRPLPTNNAVQRPRAPKPT